MLQNSGVRSKDGLTGTIKRLSIFQLVSIVIAALVIYLQKGEIFAVALLFGGMISLAATWVHAWRLYLATQVNKTLVDKTKADGIQGLDSSEIVKGTVLKYLTVIGLFMLGMKVLQLEPLAVVLGFFVAQASFLFIRGYAPRSVAGKHG